MPCDPTSLKLQSRSVRLTTLGYEKRAAKPAGAIVARTSGTPRLPRPSAGRFLHFARDQLALIFRVDIESLAGSLNGLLFAGRGDYADVGEAVAVLLVDAPNARPLPYASHG